MHVAIVLAQIDATRRTITAIVFALLAVAAALALLTAWYWRVTDPRRRSGSKQTPPPRRGRRNRDPAPEVDPSPGGATADLASVGNETVTAQDQTRIMDRNAILNNPQSAEPAVSAAAPIIHQPSGPGTKLPDATIDLRTTEHTEPDQRKPAAPPAPDNTKGRGRVTSGAHDEGLSLEEWLASGEED